MCYLPIAKGGHAKHVETGQFAHDTHSMLLEVLMKSVLTMECAPCDQVSKNGSTPQTVEPGTWWRGGRPFPPPGRAEAQTQTSQASRGSDPKPNCDAAYAAWYVCEVVARGKEEHIAPETRVARDLAVPTGGGVILLRVCLQLWHGGKLFGAAFGFFPIIHLRSSLGKVPAFFSFWRVRGTCRQKINCQQGRDRGQTARFCGHDKKNA